MVLFGMCGVIENNIKTILQSSHLQLPCPIHALQAEPYTHNPSFSSYHPPHSELNLPRPGDLPPTITLCGKMDVLDRLLIKLHQGGHKVRGEMSLGNDLGKSALVVVVSGYHVS